MSAEIVCLPITLKDLSHELRTPLTGILGMVDQLHEEPLTPQQKSCVEDIKNAGMSLLNLANCLLDAKRLATINEEGITRLTQLFSA